MQKYTVSRGDTLYFLQEWGYNVWNICRTTRIVRTEAEEATRVSLRKLDGSFFRVRFDRLTPTEREYMRALAGLGPEPQRSSDVAAEMGRKANSVAPVRDDLIKKGMLYSPEHGMIAFTVPLFDEFMRREMP